MTNQHRRPGDTTPLFLQRIHAREAAEKEAREAERRRLALLALDIASAILKAGAQQAACGHRRRAAPKKDVWSHLGDFIFGD